MSTVGKKAVLLDRLTDALTNGTPVDDKKTAGMKRLADVSFMYTV